MFVLDRTEGDRRRALPIAALLLAALSLAALLLSMSAARADGFALTSLTTKTAQADGTEEIRAGAHPYSATVDYTTSVRTDASGQFVDGSQKDVVVDLPPGFVGGIANIPTCSRLDLIAATCPADSQVGVVTLHQVFYAPSEATTAVFNVTPGSGKIADLAFQVLGVPVHIVASLRPDDYGLRTTLRNISQMIPTAGAKLTLWGVPASQAHDGQRGPRFDCYGDRDEPHCTGGDGRADPPVAPYGNFPSSVSPTPFLSNPTSCGGPLATKLSVDSWAGPGDFKTLTAMSSPVTECDGPIFEPHVSVAPTSSTPDAPAGLSMTLKLPQSDAVNGVRAADLKDVVVTLPEGMSINPASADGLTPCADDQLNLGTAAAVSCPEASKIGTVEATTPLLKEQLSGGVYLRPQNSDDPQSGEMFRIALVLANEERGISVRLPGQVAADPVTGRLVTTFANNPQVPVSEFKLQFKGGPRASLATPATCGTKTVDAHLTSWSGKSVDRQTTFDIDCPAGLGGFSPAISAGTKQPVGGAFSPFNLSITKPDGNADLAGLTMQLPAGLLAQLKGNIGSQVGTVTAFSGPGSNPYPLPGQVFLEGQYGDAPFSLKVVVPAKAGPFDLGTVVVRQKVYVDSIDAHVTVVSDPLPTIVKGVPVRMQRLDLSIDKPGFIVNPTSCAPMAFGGTLNAVGGQSVPINVRFQVGSCSDLALKPQLGLTLSGKGQTKDGGHPAVSAALSQPAGQANLKKVRVTLPLSLALDPDNSRSDALCSFAEGSKPDPKCPASSIVGKASAISSILNQPLSGPVYFVKNERKDPKSGRSIRTTPKLVIPLVGENGVKLTLTGRSDVVDDQLVTTFDNIPDAPVSSFKMDINGGKKGILVISGADICAASQVADQQIDGQNAKQADADVYIQTPSCPLKVISKKVGKTSVAVKVGGVGAGKVIITGRGIKKTTKTISKSTVATITARRSNGKPGKVTVSFDPAGPAKARKTTR